MKEKLNDIKETFVQNAKGIIYRRSFAVTLVLIGILLRVKHYLENRSFWVDEAWVAVSISSRTWKEIFSHFRILSDMPHLPLGFALLEKTSITLLGNHEYALRLFPLIAGILSLVLFCFLLKSFVDEKTFPIALCLFVFCDPLVYYAAELKQYSSDVLISLVFFWIFQSMRKQKCSGGHVFLFGCMGAVGLWISNASIFVLTSVGLTLAGACCVTREWKRFLKLNMAFLLWLGSFILLYKISLDYIVHNEATLVTWQDAFIPDPVFSLTSLLWLKKVCVNVFKDPVGLSFPWLWLFVFVVGCVKVVKQDKEKFFFLLLPILLTLIAAILHKYPFRGRMLLFTVPIFLIFISEGTIFLLDKLKKFKWIATGVIMALLFAHPVTTAAHYLTHDRIISENRDVMKFLKRNFGRNDFLFMNNSAQYPYWYYVGKPKAVYLIPDEANLGQGNIPAQGVIVGKIFDILRFSPKNTPYAFVKFVLEVYSPEGLFRDSVMYNNYSKKHSVIHKNKSFSFLGRDRIWFLFYHGDPRVKDLMIQTLEQQGEKVTSYERGETSLYLYALRRKRFLKRK